MSCPYLEESLLCCIERILLKIIAPLDIQDKNPANQCGNTPLHHAAEKGLLNIFRLIMKHTQDPLPRNNEGKTPFHYAARNGHHEMCSEIINILEVKNIQDKNPQDFSGVTPLHDAVVSGHLNICILIYATGKFFSVVFS